MGWPDALSRELAAEPALLPVRALHCVLEVVDRVVADAGVVLNDLRCGRRRAPTVALVPRRCAGPQSAPSCAGAGSAGAGVPMQARGAATGPAQQLDTKAVVVGRSR
eukprot:2007608-Alexandrium_andersonii.AAC.1